jgi:hypothetical protein
MTQTSTSMPTAAPAIDQAATSAPQPAVVQPVKDDAAKVDEKK